LKEPAYDPEVLDEDIEFVCNKLEITKSELLSYLNSKNKSYKDYKNQAWIYDIGSKAMRVLGLERGGKR